MSVGLKSIDKAEKLATINRRLNGNTKGLGYWGAYDAQRFVGKTVKQLEK